MKAGKHGGLSADSTVNCQPSGASVMGTFRTNDTLGFYLTQSPLVGLVAVVCGFLSVVDSALAQPWTVTTGLGSAVALSADAHVVVAAGPGISISTNAGESWRQIDAPSNWWSSIACSADATKLVAASSTGLIYLSPDAGATWTRASAPTNHWISVVSSANGARLAAVAAPLSDPATSTTIGQGAIYNSCDMGATWVQTTAPNTNWTGIASSADGTKLVAVSGPLFDYSVGHFVGEGGIYTSMDAGATWNQTSAPAMSWSCVASSADGTKLVAADEHTGPFPGGLIYTSTNSGATWAAISGPTEPIYGWFSVASSADGARLAAASAYDIYISTNSGLTWTSSAPGVGGFFLVSSADGGRLAAASLGGRIFTWPYSGPWRIINGVSNYLRSVVSSADGTKLVAAGSGPIFSSRDSGATWIQTSAPSNDWSRVASSADGARLVAAAYSDEIYCSSNTGGTWSRTSAPTNFWVSVASSADGTKLVASAAHYSAIGELIGDGGIYRSSDSGATWIRTSAPCDDWTSVASSVDGSQLVAGSETAIYHSLDAGATWTLASAPTNYWTSVASSADGTKLVAAALCQGGEGCNSPGTTIYRSSDSGATWEPTSAPIGDGGAVASSADGTILFALPTLANRLESEPEISTNSGASWAPAECPAGGWSAVACSADGSYVVALGEGQIATLRAPPPAPPAPPSPRLAVGWSRGNVTLSWRVPSTPFVLQQNSDLRSSGWVQVPASPTLNLTNLYYQLRLPPASGNAFYRLKQQ